MIRKYRYDKNTGKMVEVDMTNRPKRTAPHVMGDIEPYHARGPEYGKLISSRSQHREYLRRHNLIEVGNEKDYITGKKR
jgi:hypothetical protein